MNSATGPVERQQTWGERVAVLERELASMQAERDELQTETRELRQGQARLLQKIADDRCRMKFLQSGKAWPAKQRQVDFLRDRLKRCQEHNRQADARVRQVVDGHLVSMRAWADEVAEQRGRAEQAEAERNEARGEAAMAMAECDAMQFRLTQVGRERDAAKAALGRAVDVLQCVSFLYHTDRPDTTHDFDTCEACQTAAPALRDPQGQQAAAEWQRLQRIERAAQRLVQSWDAYQAAYDSQDTVPGDGSWGEAMSQAHTEKDAAEDALRAALQQPPPAAEEAQQDG